MGVCLLLLLAGILNFVNIYLVFMLKRSKEYGIKKVFGIRGRALFLQLWTENMLMIVISLLLAWFFIEIFSGYASRLLGSDVSLYGFRLATVARCAGAFATTHYCISFYQITIICHHRVHTFHRKFTAFCRYTYGFPVYPV